MPGYVDMLKDLRSQGHPEGDVLRLTEERWQGEPVRLAEARGHTVVDDSAGRERYTCTACGRAVLRVSGNIYGSAVTEDCTPKGT